MLNSKEDSLTTMKMHWLKKMMRSGLFWTWIAVLLLLLDRFSKMWAIENLILFDPKPILPIFNLTLAYNTGAAFSFLHSASGWQNFFLGGLAVVVSGIILVWLYKLSYRDRWLSIAMSLILGGALGNVWDRILYGFVIDFFDFHIGNWHFAIFNVADSAISIGAVMLLLNWLFAGKAVSS